MTTFNLGIINGGSWGSIVNWLEPKTEAPSRNLACPNPWNALHVQAIIYFVLNPKKTNANDWKIKYSCLLQIFRVLWMLSPRPTNAIYQNICETSKRFLTENKREIKILKNFVFPEGNPTKLCFYSFFDSECIAWGL